MTRREILRRYRHLRAMVTHHHSAALKFLTPAAIIERARRLGLAAGQALIADNEKEMTLLFDLVIYAAKEGRSRAIDRYAKAAQLPAGSDEALMLEAMRHAHFSLWRVERRHDITGLVLTDLRDHAEVWLVDEGLQTSTANGWVFAARLSQPDRFAMTSGLVVPVHDETIRKLINHNQARRQPEPDRLDEDSRLATDIYRAAVDQRLMDRIAFR
jgi:hypothetical protein